MKNKKNIFIAALSLIDIYCNIAGDILPFSLAVTYTTSIDVIIPCHKKDAPMLDAVINSIRQNGKNIRCITVVSSEKFTDNADWFNENLYPFTKKDIANVILANTLANLRHKVALIIKQNPGRISWIYQQLLKLYAPFVIPDILPNVLVADADTVFLKPVEFLTDDGKILFAPRSECNPLYFAHARKLIPGLKRVFPNYSGVAHHMLFCRDIVNSLFLEITKVHKVEPWKAFCLCFDPIKIEHSVASEYEIYFNYVFQRYPQRAKIRILPWRDFKDLSKLDYFVAKYKKEGYACTSCHSYSRGMKVFRQPVNRLPKKGIMRYTPF